ncbi:MAG TPA: nucleotidyltransferase family protein [Candidatus Udaeobacter sp.]|nr:nucleotidyltransferase family protein [Candidatus Udaeobacter sp.]
MNARTRDIDLANLPVAILAGGLATRLRPATEKIPKALLSVADEPFLVHQLRLLRSEGFRKVVLCVGYLGEMIEATIGDGKRLGLKIDYSFDGPTLLGTGGALKRALPELGKRFLVIYGDSYMPADYGAIVEAFVQSGKPALMTVLENEGRWDASNVWFEKGKIQRYDKRLRTPEMRHIDYGISVLTPGVFAGFPENVPFDLADLYSRLVSDQQMAAYEVNQRFYEIGSAEGLAELDSLLRNKKVSLST